MNRSLELVEETIADARDGIVVVCGPKSKPRPITDAERKAIAKTKLKLPESLQRWLEFDAPSLELFDSKGNPTAFTTLNAFLADELAEVLGGDPEDYADGSGGAFDWLLGPYAKLGEKPAIVLPPSASQAHILVLDGKREPPVLGYEKEEVWEKYPSFGACIAHLVGNRDPDETRKKSTKKKSPAKKKKKTSR